MSVLEQLIGKPLHECTQEELEQAIMTGRIGREVEAAGARSGRVKKSGGGGGKGNGKKRAEISDFDLLLDDDDEDVSEIELED